VRLRGRHRRTHTIDGAAASHLAELV